LVAPSLSVTKDDRRIRHSSLSDHISQTRLPLSFDLADATFTTHSHIPTTKLQGRTTSKDLAYTLAYKVLQISMFFSIKMLASNFAPAQVFHLVGKMLKDKVSLPSLDVAQVVTESSTNDDLVKLRIKFATKAIVGFEEGALQ